jgi:hypothetical protein
VSYFRLFQWRFIAPYNLVPWAADRLAPPWFRHELTTLTLRMQHSEKLRWRRWLEYIGHFCHLSAPSQSVSNNTVFTHRGYATRRTCVFITCNIRKKTVLRFWIAHLNSVIL